MKKLLIFLFLAASAFAQSTTVSTTGVVDTDGFTWAYGSYQIAFVPNPSWPSPGTYTWSGGNLQDNLRFTGALSSSGAFSVSIPSNTAISPAGSQWKFTICPNANTGCFSVTLAASGSTQDITSALNAYAQGPRFPISNALGYGYGTIEVNPTPSNGTLFFNVTNGNTYQYTPSGWIILHPSGGGVFSVTNADGSLTISPTTGNVVASLNVANANTWTAQQTFLGAGIASLTTGTPSFSSAAAFSNPLTYEATAGTVTGCGEGYATDSTTGTGNNFCLTDTTITSYSYNWQSTNWTDSSPFSGSGLPSPLNHMGGPAYFDGYLLVPLEYQTSTCVGVTNQTLALYNSSTGALYGSASLPGGNEASAVDVVPVTSSTATVYVGQYCNGGTSTLQAYDLVISPLSLTRDSAKDIALTLGGSPYTLVNLQGLSYNVALGTHFASSDPATNPTTSPGYISTISPSGAVNFDVYTVPQATELESLDATTGQIRYATAVEGVWYLTPSSAASGPDADGYSTSINMVAVGPGSYDYLFPGSPASKQFCTQTGTFAGCNWVQCPAFLSQPFSIFNAACSVVGQTPSGQFTIPGGTAITNQWQVANASHGLADDGTYWYVVNGEGIYQYAQSAPNVVQASNTTAGNTAAAAAGYTSGGMNSGAASGGYVYFGSYPTGSSCPYSNLPVLAQFGGTPGSLAWVQNFPISGASPAMEGLDGIAVVPGTPQTFYLFDFCNGAYAWKFTLTGSSTWAFASAIPLTTAISNPRGAVYWPSNNELVVANAANIYAVSLTGTVTKIYTTPYLGIIEGVAISSAGLIEFEQNNTIYTISQNQNCCAPAVAALGSFTPGDVVEAASTSAVQDSQQQFSGMATQSWVQQNYSSVSRTIAQAPGDLACAEAADPTIGAQTVTGGSSTSSSMTYTMASVPSYMYAGQIVQAQGNSPTGYNAGPLTITATTSTTVTVSSTNNPGTWASGGTLSLYCANQTSDAISGSPYQFANSYSLPANYFGTGTMLSMTSELSFFTSTGSPAYTLYAHHGSSPLFAPSGTITNTSSLTGRPGLITYQMVSVSPTLLNVDISQQTLPTTSNNVTFSNIYTSPVTMTTSAQTLSELIYFAATGVASISPSSVSGCTVTGTSGQTVLLTGFNDSSTATATVTLGATVSGAALSSSNVGSVTITSRGSGATAAPTSATCSAGTASSASGTASFTSTLGGAQGNAVLQRAMVVKTY